MKPFGSAARGGHPFAGLARLGRRGPARPQAFAARLPLWTAVALSSLGLAMAGCSRSEAAPEPQPSTDSADSPGRAPKARATQARARGGGPTQASSYRAPERPREKARRARPKAGAELRRQLNRKVAGCIRRLHEAHPHSGGALEVELRLRSAAGGKLRVQSVEEAPGNTLGESVLFECLERIVLPAAVGASPAEPIRLSMPVEPLSH